MKFKQRVSLLDTDVYMYYAFIYYICMSISFFFFGANAGLIRIAYINLLNPEVFVEHVQIISILNSEPASSNCLHHSYNIYHGLLYPTLVVGYNMRFLNAGAINDLWISA